MKNKLLGIGFGVLVFGLGYFLLFSEETPTPQVGQTFLYATEEDAVNASLGQDVTTILIMPNVTPDMVIVQSTAVENVYSVRVTAGNHEGRYFWYVPVDFAEDLTPQEDEGFVIDREPLFGGILLDLPHGMSFWGRVFAYHSHYVQLGKGWPPILLFVVAGSLGLLAWVWLRPRMLELIKIPTVDVLVHDILTSAGLILQLDLQVTYRKSPNPQEEAIYDKETTPAYINEKLQSWVKGVFQEIDEPRMAGVLRYFRQRLPYVVEEVPEFRPSILGVRDFTVLYQGVKVSVEHADALNQQSVEEELGAAEKIKAKRLAEADAQYVRDMVDAGVDAGVALYRRALSGMNAMPWFDTSQMLGEASSAEEPVRNVAPPYVSADTEE